MRDVGHVFFGEVFIVPKPGPTDLPRKIRTTRESAKSIHWRLHDITVTIVDRLEPAQTRADDESSNSHTAPKERRRPVAADKQKG